MKLRIVALVLTTFFALSLTVAAQEESEVECGSIVEAELTSSEAVHDYLIDFAPGDMPLLTVDPYGDTLSVEMDLYDPSQNLAKAARSNSGQTKIEIKELTLSSRGTYTIRVIPYRGAGGIYTLTIGCVLNDGTVIEPGDIAPVRPTPIPDPSNFTGTGFPGLAPVDFTTGVTIPFATGVPNVGSISPGFEGVFGFTLDVNSGESYNFEFTRMSGNINLGIAILSPDNQVVFYGGMIAGDSLSTQVTFPASGQYTIGVFRVDLLPPDTPEATTFQVTAIAN